MKLITCMLFILVGCGAKMTPVDETNLAKLDAQEKACIVAHSGDKANIDFCRKEARALFEAREAKQYPDAGFGDAS